MIRTNIITAVLATFNCGGKGYYNDHRGGAKTVTICDGCDGCRPSPASS